MTDKWTIEKQKFLGTLEILFTLCSVRILKEIKNSTYELLNEEIYQDEELDLIEKSSKV